MFMAQHSSTPARHRQRCVATFSLPPTRCHVSHESVLTMCCSYCWMSGSGAVCCDLSQVTRANIVATSMPLHALLAHTAQASRNTPYTHHMHNAVNMIIRVPRFTPRCSRLNHTVCNCGIHAIRPVAPATSPIDSIMGCVMWLFMFPRCNNLHSLRSGRGGRGPGKTAYIHASKNRAKKFSHAHFRTHQTWPVYHKVSYPVV